MSGFVIPIVALSFVLIINQSGKVAGTKESKKQKKGQVETFKHRKLSYINEQQRQGYHAKKEAELTKNIKFSNRKEQQDYNAIYNYIYKKYKLKDKEEAKLIALYITRYSKKSGIDPKMSAALIARESSFNRNAISKTGAKGLGQIKDFNKKDLDINNSFNIKQNVKGTVTYLSKMIQKWQIKDKNIQTNKKGTDNKENIYMALASYYKGFTGVKKTGVDPKTKKYIEDILRNYNEIKTYNDIKTHR
ncbi:MAG: transglycosylase SLT domain-containing protein [bacterium]